MVEEPPKPFSSNIAVSDVLVPVDMGPERRLGVVGMDHLDVVQAENAVEFGDRLLQTFGGGHVVAGSVAMASVDAETDIDVRELNGELAHQREFFQAAAQGSAGARRILEQNGQIPCVEATGCFGYGPNHAGNAFLN